MNTDVYFPFNSTAAAHPQPAAELLAPARRTVLFTSPGNASTCPTSARPAAASFAPNSLEMARPLSHRPAALQKWLTTRRVQSSRDVEEAKLTVTVIYSPSTPTHRDPDLRVRRRAMTITPAATKTAKPPYSQSTLNASTISKSSTTTPFQLASPRSAPCPPFPQSIPKNLGTTNILITAGEASHHRRAMGRTRPPTPRAPLANLRSQLFRRTARPAKVLVVASAQQRLLSLQTAPGERRSPGP